jgi:hypothetical protein
MDTTNRMFFIDGQFQEPKQSMAWPFPEPKNQWVPHTEVLRGQELNRMTRRYDDWQTQKQVASYNLARRLRSRQQHRYHVSKVDPKPYFDRVRRDKESGKRLANQVAALRIQTRAQTLDEASRDFFIDQWRKVILGMRAAGDVWQSDILFFNLPDTARCIITEAEQKMSNNQWKPAMFGDYSLEIDPTYMLHMVHVSEDDPSLIAYSPSYAYLKANRYIKTKPGKYLTKFFSNRFDESRIRTLANQHIMATRPLEMKLATTPDDWEWVYEHGRGFSSCMVYDHPSSRYLDPSCKGENHPVRAYACKHEDNHLALAYLLDDPTSPNAAVIARTIVNTKTMTYTRLYGDDRMHDVLTKAGYTRNAHKTMNGQVITAKKLGSAYIAPYLDSGTVEWLDGEEDCGYFIITEDGTSTSASGLVDINNCSTQCRECGDHMDEEDMTYVEEDDGYVCEYCLDRYYVYAYTRRYEEWCRRGDCVEVGGTWYHTDYISNHDIVQTDDGEYYHMDDCYYLEYLNDYVHESEVDYLDRPHGADTHARGCDTVYTGNGETIHEDDAVSCYVTDERYHADVCWLVHTALGEVHYYPDNMDAQADDVYVFADNGVFVLLFDNPPSNAKTLREFVSLYGYNRVFSNVVQGCDSETMHIALMDVAELEEPMLLAA